MAHHILFEIVTPLNILVTTVYWSILRERALATFATTKILALHSGIIHLMPMVCNLICFSVTDVSIKASHGLGLLPLCILYGYSNYQVTKAQGYPVYHFLTWEDETSFLIFGCITMAGLLSYMLLAVLTKLIKRPQK